MCGERRRCPGHLLLPQPLLAVPRRRLMSPRSSLSRAAPSPLPWLFPLSSFERSHRRRSTLVQPQPSPRLSDTPWSSAVPPSSSSSSHTTRRAPTRRPCPLLPPSAMEIAGDFPPSPSLPRARRGHLCTRREPLFLSPLLSSLRSSPSFISHRGRELLAAGHGVAMATATTACSRAHRRAQHDLMSP